MDPERESGGGWCARLYEEVAGNLVLYGRALGLSHSEAEDVVQDVFLALMRLAEAPAHPGHYAVRTFRNRALNYRRNAWRRLSRELECQRWFEQEPGESVAERSVMRELAALPAEQREVIVLKIWHGLTFDEIAALLELSANTVAGRYRYGLQKLRNLFKGLRHESAEWTGEPTPMLETPWALPEA